MNLISEIREIYSYSNNEIRDFIDARLLELLTEISYGTLVVVTKK